MTERRYPLSKIDSYGQYHYGPWSIQDPLDYHLWEWWREDADGFHLPGNGEAADLEGCIAAIHAYEDQEA